MQKKHQPDVVLVVKRLWQGGGERVCVNLANSFAELGLKVTLVVGNLDGEIYLREVSESVGIVDLRARTRLQFVLRLSRYSPNLTNVPTLVFNFDATVVLALLCRKGRIVARCLNNLSAEFDRSQGSFLRSIKSSLMRALIVASFRQCRFVIAQSSGMMHDLVRHYVPASIIRVIHNPVAGVYAACESPLPRQMRKYFLYVGRLAPQKAVDHLIKVYAALNTATPLNIVGDGPDRQRQEELAIGLGLEDKIRFLGTQTDCVELYRNAFCTILTSRYEGFPNVLVESVATGTPVVSYDIPYGPSEIVVPGVNGVLVRDRDVPQMLAVLSEIDRCDLFDYAAVQATAVQYSGRVIAIKYLDLLHAT